MKSVPLSLVAISEVDYNRQGSQRRILTLVRIVHIVLKSLKQRSYHASNHEPSLLAASRLEQSMWKPELERASKIVHNNTLKGKRERSVSESSALITVFVLLSSAEEVLRRIESNIQIQPSASHVGPSANF